MHKGEASQGTSWPLINVNVWNKKGATLGRDAYLFNPVTNGNPSPDCLWVMIIPGEAWREKQLEQKTTAIIPPVEVRERKPTLSTKPSLGRITSSAECLFKGAFSIRADDGGCPARLRKRENKPVAATVVILISDTRLAGTIISHYTRHKHSRQWSASLGPHRAANMRLRSTN